MLTKRGRGIYIPLFLVKRLYLDPIMNGIEKLEIVILRNLETFPSFPQVFVGFHPGKFKASPSNCLPFNIRFQYNQGKT